MRKEFWRNWEEMGRLLDPGGWDKGDGEILIKDSTGRATSSFATSWTSEANQTKRSTRTGNETSVVIYPSL